MVTPNSGSNGFSGKASRWPRVLRGLGSFLAGLAFPLGGWWIGERKDLHAESRLHNGYVLILPGVEGKSSLPLNIALGLVDAGVDWAIDIHDWTTGFWPLFTYHLRHERRSRRRAARIAAKIVAYQDRFPGRPTYLIGHSGGGGLAVMVLESLPLNRRVTGAVLLGPALSRHYDLTEALLHTRIGIWNFYSPLDFFYLTAGTFVFGTMDGRHDVSAGAWGFSRPASLSDRARHHYRTRLRQRPYELKMASFCHFGGHLGWANRIFAAEWLSRLMKSTTRRIAA